MADKRDDMQGWIPGHRFRSARNDGVEVFTSTLGYLDTSLHGPVAHGRALLPRHRISASPRQTLAGWVLRTHELGVGKIGPYEGSSGHVGPREIGPSHVGPGKIHVVEFAAGKVGTEQIAS